MDFAMPWEKAIEHAKWQQWDEMLAIFESYPGL